MTFLVNLKSTSTDTKRKNVFMLEYKGISWYTELTSIKEGQWRLVETSKELHIFCVTWHRRIQDHD